MLISKESPERFRSPVDGRRWLVLAIACFATYAILVDTSIVNVALPTLVGTLGATTTELKWIVDAYNLAFAALVLTGGMVGDRYGRKPTLVVGLAVFGAGNLLAALVDSPSGLIGARAVMGIGAAFVFPTTLSIISNAFVDRAERAKAIGIWGAMTGLGVASGPIVGGWALEHFYWGSIFLLMVPPALLAIILATVFVPNSSDPNAPRLDLGGLLLSTLGLGVLVATVIEAPEWGWTSPTVLAGFVLAAVLGMAFVWWERRLESPMLEVGLFANPRFSAASGAITVAFFGLFGFIFLITQYFQFVLGYSPLETGVRILPVAFSIAVASIGGVRLALSLGNKIVVTTGLVSMSIAFAWISQSSPTTPYIEIAGQMIALGLGLGLTSAPATEAIMGAVPREKAGQGSAVNDATREVGGTLGVATIGSVFASLYVASLNDQSAWISAPAALLDRARDGIGLALGAVEANRAQLGDQTADALIGGAQTAFVSGLEAGCLVAAGVTAAGAIMAARFLPSRPQSAEETLDTTPSSFDVRAADIA